MADELRNIIEYKEFLRQFTAQQLKTRYRGSVLGFLWTLLNPALTCLALSVVFSYINHWDMKTAGLYFFAGYIPWIFFLSATVGATTSIVGNAHYVNRIYVPRAIFPIATVLVGFVDLLAGLAVVLAYMISTGAVFAPALAILPVSVVLLAAFLLGMAFFCASVNVFVRDFQFLWATLTFLWFFFTPILYPLSTIPATVRPYFEMNPVLPFIALFQEPICHGAIPPAGTIGLAGIYAVVALVLGAGVFFRSERSFYLYL